MRLTLFFLLSRKEVKSSKRGESPFVFVIENKTRERDIFEEIIDIGKRRGVLTYDEINEALPSEFFSPDELEDLMDILQDMGVKVIDHRKPFCPKKK